VKPYLPRAACAAALVLATILAAPAGATDPAGTQYFAIIPGENIPVSITSFSSDARADVSTFSYGNSPGERPAHGKFSVETAVSPFDNVRAMPTLIVLARTPEKLITFTFTDVTIDDVTQTGSKSERITFGAADYSVKYGARTSLSLGK